MPETGHHTVAQCPMSPHADSGIQPPHHLIIDPSPEPQNLNFFSLIRTMWLLIVEEIHNMHWQKKINLHISFFSSQSRLSSGVCSTSEMSPSWQSSLRHSETLPPSLIGVVKVTETAAFSSPHSGRDFVPVSADWLWATWRSCRVGGMTSD